MTAPNDFPSLTVDDAARILTGADRVLICIHRNPDGDAVGSGFALAQLLRTMGKEARVVCADEIPHRLRFLLRGQEDCAYTPGMEDGFSLVCAVDTASPAQLGTLMHLAGKIALSIDHHAANEAYSPNWTDPSASASGEILFRLFRLLTGSGAAEKSADVCRLLYAAIVSDTGSFKYANTTRETLLTAAELVGMISEAADGGDDPAMICHRLFECRTVTELYAQRAGIDALRLAHGGALGVVVFTVRMLRENGITSDDIGNIVSLPRTVEGVQIALSVKQSEEDPTAWRVSARASCDLDVSSVCAAFGGGGHRRAAGCVISAADAEEAFTIVCEAFGRLLDAEEDA